MIHHRWLDRLWAAVMPNHPTVSRKLKHRTLYLPEILVSHVNLSNWWALSSVRGPAPSAVGLDAMSRDASGGAFRRDLRRDSGTGPEELERELCRLRRELERVRTERDELAELYEAAPVGCIDFDRRGYIRQINQTGADVLRRPKSELVGKPFVPLIDPGDIQKFVIHLKESLQGGRRRHVELRLRKKGEPVVLQLFSAAVQSANDEGAICRSTIVDLTDQKPPEDNPWENNELFRVMTDTAPVLIWMSGADGGCRYVNQTWLQFRGHSLAEELGRGWLDGVHPEDVAGLSQQLERPASRPEGFSVEFRLQRHDGQYRWFLNTGMPRFSSSGAFSGYIGTCVDISERRSAEELRREILQDFEILVQERTANLKMANLKLRREVSARKRLEKQIVEVADREKQRIGNDLHDGLGQQLTGVAFLSKLLEQKLSAKASSEKSDAAQIHALVNQALTQTRELARGLHVVELQAGGLPSALRELRSQVESLFSIPCELQCDRSVRIEDAAVATHVFRIAQEAVNNAVKHGKARRIRIHLAREDRRATLTVTDDGIGCPKGPKARQGMGMHTMRYRTEMIRGTFEIQRAPGGGTVVTCSFPLASSKNPKS